MQLSASVEDYLEAIYQVVQEKQVALPRDIRKILNVGRSSVSGALKHLTQLGLVKHESYGVITLTPQGEAAAQEIVRKHAALKDFFVNVLAVDEHEADRAACAMEHVVSDTILGRFLAYAQFANACPNGGGTWVHGQGFVCASNHRQEGCEVCGRPESTEANAAPISEKESEMKNQTSAPVMTLKDVRPGGWAAILKVGGEGAIRMRLLDLGVTKGAAVYVEKVAPLGDPIDIKVKGYHLSLRKEEAQMIQVRPLPDGGQA